MTNIISYAQNFEDVMLWRALGHIENGFYIDIGAQDPIIDSVSLAFHEHGWHDIHVEPTPHYAELLRQQRPGDTIIQAAIGNGPAVLTFFEIPDTGISTADPVIAQQHRERGFDVHEITVPCITLAATFDSCPAQEIHWLKIDIEGFEQQVLSSWDTSLLRPWIVIVESTLPLTQIETNENWEEILIGYGYSPVYFDGLNRYYVSSAHPELKDAFRSPPNVFDGFTLNGTASATFHHLIDARYQQKINETIAQNEQQKIAATQETERLNQSLTVLEQNHAEREQTLTQELQAEQQALQHLTQDQVRQERKYAEQTSQIQQNLENLLRMQTQREQEIAAQLLTIQQQANTEKRSLNEQIHHAQSQQIQQLQTSADVQRQLIDELLFQKEIGLSAQGKISILEQQMAELRRWEKQLHTNLAQQTEHAATLAQHVANIQNTLLWRLYTLFRPKRWRDVNAIHKIDLIHLDSNSDTQPENQSHEIATQNQSEPTQHQPDVSQQTIDESVPAIVNIITTEPEREFSPMHTIQHIFELFIFDDHEFINAAYRTLLGREPDQNGMNYYLGRLRMGYGKASVITQLAQSSERNTHKEIKGLTQLLKEEHRANHWFWGMFARSARQARRQLIMAEYIAKNTAEHTQTYPAIAHRLDHLIDQQSSLLPQKEFTANTLKGIHLSRGTVIRLFELILGREPESDQTILQHAQQQSIQALKEVLLNSEEFSARMRLLPEQARLIFQQQIHAQVANLRD